MSATTTAAALFGGVPTAVGSLPFVEVEAAVDAALALQPELPAAPSLPSRSPTEGMLAQIAAGLDGVRIAPDGNLTVDRRLGPAPSDVPLDDDAWRSALAFLAASAGRRPGAAVKLQLTGPVTLAMALVAAGARPAKAFPIAGRHVDGRVRALVAEAKATLGPGTPLVLVLDEPGLTAAGDGFPFGVDDTIDLLSSALASAGPETVTGVHCCGPTDWRLVLHAGPDLLSLPVGPSVVRDGGALGAFLDRGGWIAWGAVPTDRPLGEREDAHWRNLTGLWNDLSREGCDAMLLRTQAAVTPACGLAHHHPGQVSSLYGLVRRVAERVQDQALAARMSAGA